jgi:hypothetical protein
VPRSATAATSAASMNPRSGANAPDVSSSRSPSWVSLSVQEGQPDSSAGSGAGAGAGDESGEEDCSVSGASEHDF